MYPLKMRQKILAIKDKEKLSFAMVGKRFAIHPRTIQRWKERLEPKTTRNKPATKVDMKALEKDVQQRPDDYQWERAQRFGVSSNTILYALRRLHLSHKKNSVSSKS